MLGLLIPQNLLLLTVTMEEELGGGGGVSSYGLTTTIRLWEIRWVTQTLKKKEIKSSGEGVSQISDIRKMEIREEKKKIFNQKLL